MTARWIESILKYFIPLIGVKMDISSGMRGGGYTGLCYDQVMELLWKGLLDNSQIQRCRTKLRP